MTSQTERAGPAGRPLLALVAIIGCWVGARIVVIELPAPGASPPVHGIAHSHSRAVAAGSAPGIAAGPRRLPPYGASPAPREAAAVPAAVSAAGLALPPAPILARPMDAALAPAPLPPPAPMPVAPRIAAGHNLLWMAAMQAMPLPPAIAAALAGQENARGTRPQPSTRRWSGDGWLILRQRSEGFAAAGLVAPVYGASQAGAVLRYELAPGARTRPAAFVRAVTALGASRDRDLAAGLAVRPSAAVPVTAHGELRASFRGDRVDLRPAAFVAGGIDSARLPGGVRARGYAQLGVVGGRDATAFADGNLVAERDVARIERADASLGAGVWGGAQRGAARIDIGPSAALRFRLGETNGRLAVDYRLRVAGNAEPAAGAALTLSAGF